MSGGTKPVSALEEELRAKGINNQQRKRIIEAARLGGIANPLKQMTLSNNAAVTHLPWSRGGPGADNSQQTSAPAPLMLSAPSLGHVSVGKKRPAPRPTKDDDDDADVDSFLSGGRKIAKAKLEMEARKQQDQEEEQQEAEKRQQRIVEEAELGRQRRLKEERDQLESVTRTQEEERRREARRQGRREEKLRRREEKKRLKGEEAGNDLADDDDSADEPAHPDQRQSSKGFFSQAYSSNNAAKAIWSEKIKGIVSNNYKGTSDADLERRFRMSEAAPSSNAGLMTEEEVLAALRKASPRAPSISSMQSTAEDVLAALRKSKSKSTKH